MSELRVTTLKHESAAADNITLAANGNVGINTTTAGQLLEINQPSSTGYAATRLRSNSRAFDIGLASSATGWNQNNFYFYDVTAGAERMVIDSAGRVTMPYQPSFKAHVVGSPTMNSTEVIPFSNTSLNTGSCYNTANRTFTAPVAGIYVFGGVFRIEGAAGYVHLGIKVNGSNGCQNGELPGLSTGNGSGFTSAPFVYFRYLSAGDSLVITGHWDSTLLRNINAQSFLYGYLQS